MDRLKNIVVGVNFTEPSNCAFAQAIRVATWNAARLHAIHVTELWTVEELAELCCINSVANEGANLCRRAREELEALYARQEDVTLHPKVPKSPKHNIDFHVVVGDPFADILRCVADVSADLLVVGGDRPFKYSPGVSELATKFARKAPTMVLLVRAASPGPFKRVVACVDFSDTSGRVVEQAIRVAHQEKAELHFLHVQCLPREFLSYLTPGRDNLEGARGLDDIQPRSRLEKLVRPILERETNGAITIYHVKKAHSCKTGIIEYIRETDADLAITGTRRRTRLAGILMGTTAEQIIHQSPCSVLVVKPEGSTYALG